MKKLLRTKENIHFLIDSHNKVQMHILPEESFSIETVRADNMFLNRNNPVFRDDKEVMEVRVNPVTGPVYIDGAEPGDRLEITVEDIQPGDCGNEGYYTYVPGQGLFANPYVPEAFVSDTGFCDVSAGTFDFRFGKTTIKLKTEPFIGTISIAGQDKVYFSYESNKDIVGNMDCPNAKKGSTIVMPVHVPGALLYLGDLHAKQGDGELLGCAVECDGLVTLSAKIIKKGDSYYFDLPQVNGNGRFGSVCKVSNNIERAI